MNIALCSSWNPTYNDLAAVTMPSREKYCQKHGYECVFTVGVSDRHPVWQRWKLAMDNLPKYDWLAVLDLDLLILNQDKKLEEFLDTPADLICSYDVNGFNAGVVFIRNTPWSNNFLARFWLDGSRYQATTSPEQTALAYLLYREPKDKWECRPQRQFNSFDYNHYADLDFPEGQYQHGDFILHLPAMPNDRRIQIFHKYL